MLPHGQLARSPCSQQLTVKHRFCSDIGKSHLFWPFITNKGADVFNNVSFFLPVSYSLIARLHFFNGGRTFVLRDVTGEQWLRGKRDSCHLGAVTDVCDTSHTCQSQLYLTLYQPAVVAEAVKEGERGRLSTTGGESCGHEHDVSLNRSCDEH